MEADELYQLIYDFIETQGLEVNSTADDMLADACRSICDPDPE